MPNLAAILKAELARLARKEIKLQVEPLRKQLADHRKTIASFRLDLAKLQKSATSGQRGRSQPAVGRVEDRPVARTRFSATGLKRLRKRLALSREVFGLILGVSAQTIYLWESGNSRPRVETIEKLAIVRGMTKQQVEGLLAQHSSLAKMYPRATPADRSGKKSAVEEPAKKAGASKKAIAPRGKSGIKPSDVGQTNVKRAR